MSDDTIAIKISSATAESFQLPDGRPCVQLTIPNVCVGNLTSDGALKLAALLVNAARFADTGAECTHRVNATDAAWMRAVIALGGEVLEQARKQTRGTDSN